MKNRRTFTAGAAGVGAGGLLTAAFLSAGVAVADTGGGDNDLDTVFAGAAAEAAGALAGGAGDSSVLVSAFNSADFGFDVANPDGDDTFGILNPLTDAQGDTLGTFDTNVDTSVIFGLIDNTKITVTDVNEDTLDFDGDGLTNVGDADVDVDGDGILSGSDEAINLDGDDFAGPANDFTGVAADVDGDGFSYTGDSANTIDLDGDGGDLEFGDRTLNLNENPDLDLDLDGNSLAFDDDVTADLDGDSTELGKPFAPGGDDNVTVDLDQDGTNLITNGALDDTSIDFTYNSDSDTLSFAAGTVDLDGDGTTLAAGDNSIDLDGDGLTLAGDSDGVDVDGDGVSLFGDDFIDIDGDGTVLADEDNPAGLLPDGFGVPTEDSEYAIYNFFGLFSLNASDVVAPEDGSTLATFDDLFGGNLVDEGFTATLDTPFGDFDVTDLFTFFGLEDLLF